MSLSAAPSPYSQAGEACGEVLVGMHDGVRLATDVYLPVRARRAPAVLIRLPYDKRGPISFMPAVAGYLTDRGYAVVVQDTRGKARSEGETLAFEHEVRDGHDTIEWVARQPWCTGAVAMVGDSYYGWTQWAAAASGHPALRAIVPRVTSTRIEQDWMFNGGAFCLATMVDWAACTWIDNRLHEPARDWSVRPLADLLPAWLGGRRAASLDQWMRHQEGARYWREGVFATVRAGAARVPALHMGGWWDVFRRGQLADWHAARAAGGASQRLILDATDHQWDPFRPDGGRAADPLADPAQMERFLPHYLDDVVTFLDDALGIRSAPAAPVRFRVAGGGWHEAPEWPPPDARDLVLHLADGARATADAQGGALAVAPDTARHTVRWTHDPADLVPTLDADVWRPLLELPDELAVEARADVLTFTAEPVSEPLVLCGGVEAILDAGAERPGAHVTAKLVDVSPHGSARRIAQGIRVLGSAAPDAPVVVDLGPTAYRLAPGHRLRLEVAASDFPRYLPAFDPGADPWHATAGRPAEQHLRTGGPDGSRLRMSVLT